MRKNIAAGNWKMNLTWDESQALASEMVKRYASEITDGPEMILAPTFPNLAAVAAAFKNAPKFHLAAQNVHQAPSGAFTGEVSVGMLAAVGCSHVIIGHSERRQYFGEGNDLLADKIQAVLGAGLQPIYCVGETLDHRTGGETFSVIESQIREGSFHLNEAQYGQLVLAYEPVWAIGTGKTASPEQAQEVHAFIRGLLKEQYGKALSESISILYGGSVKPANAKELFAKADIDGGLVGGASMKAESFVEIAKSF